MNRLHFFRLLATGIICLITSMTLQAQLDRLTYHDLGIHGHFGREIGVSSDLIILAEPNFSSIEKSHTGRAHVFRRNGNQWLHEGTLDNSPTQPYNHFGHDIAIQHTELAISAPDLGTGRVYLYIHEGNAWHPAQQIAIPTALHREGLHVKFGDQLAMHGEWLAVSAPGYLGAGDSIIRTGAVFVFKKQDAMWHFHQQLLPPDLTRSTQFGNDIEISGNGILISAVKGDGGAAQSGVVYLYHLDGDAWHHEYTFIDPESLPHELFGADAAMYDNTIVIGVPMYTADASAGPHGAAHVYQRFGNTWIHTALITASDAHRNDMFGYSVAIENGHIIVGAPRHDGPHITDAGKVYHYAVENGFYTEQETWLPLHEDAQPHMQFGSSLGLRDAQLVIGSHLMNNALEDSGIAYALQLDISTAQDDPAITNRHFAIHPNPVENIMQLHFDAAWKHTRNVTLYNLDGRIALQQQLSADTEEVTETLDVSALSPGTYFLHVTDGTLTAIHKWIKI